MSAWYGFNHTQFNPSMMDPTKRVPDQAFNFTLTQQAQQAFSTPQEEIVPVCVKEPPCKTWIQWKPQLSECGPTFLSWHQLTDGKVNGYEVGEKDTRIWVANLNPGHYSRGLISSAEWWNESTTPHIRNRQLFAQYLQSTLYPNYSPHEKKINHIGDSYAALRHRFGPNGIQYTSF